MESPAETWIYDEKLRLDDELQYYLQGHFGLHDMKEVESNSTSLHFSQDESYNLSVGTAKDDGEADILANVLLNDTTQSKALRNTVNDNLAPPSVESVCEVAKRGAPEEFDSAIDASPAKKDRRGCHWKEKAQQGSITPRPWQGNQYWSNKVRRLIA